MEVNSAIALLNQVVLKPGWTMEVEDYCRRHEGCVKLTFTYPARRSERELAPYEYPEEVPNGAKAMFVLTVSDTNDDCVLYRRVLELLIDIETHEWREFFRVKPTYWAPFHPHRVDGMNRWGTKHKDLVWGVA